MADTGVQEFYNRLEKLASRMPRPPDEYSVCRKFLGGLPNNIRSPLILQHGFTAEETPLVEIKKAALRQEEGLIIVNNYSRKSTKTTASDPQDYRGSSRSTRGGRGGTTRGTRGNRGGISTQTNRQDAPAQRPLRDLSTVQCRNCKEYGHMKADPKCPQYNARLHAMNTETAPNASSETTPQEPEQPPEAANQATAGPDEYYESFYQDAQYDTEDPTSYETADQDHVFNEDAEDEFYVPMHVMRIEPAPVTLFAGRMDTKSAATEPPEWVQDSRLQARRPVPTQPSRPAQSQVPLTAFVTINGVKAYTLFDSGSNTDAINPEFAHLVKAQRFTLEHPMALQLGVKGSRARITYGVRSELSMGSQTFPDCYLDVANIDKYDLILGTPFMTEHEVQLDIKKRVIRIGNTLHNCIDPFTDASTRALQTTHPRVPRPAPAAPALHAMGSTSTQ